MTKQTGIIFLSILATVAFGAACASQTLPRDSAGHFICWMAVFIAGGEIAYLLYKLFPDKPTE
jgi:hypothetical protein